MDVEGLSHVEGLVTMSLQFPLSFLRVARVVQTPTGSPKLLRWGNGYGRDFRGHLLNIMALTYEVRSALSEQVGEVVRSF